ncbi:phage tail tape measure protein [Capnocytophaga catalasegens]|uniref:Phage tail tape measure protein domain-containing protein n=1 Tax=Capnocytophaga catalasegens TaxID=1004260 RepID=A0AAV5AYI1_9FLAO|nr:phage tail tape measure protein [Capnocytophaga catalasegens]GIZ15314.1 hypothetical protein RCZ03_13140 [Capnocytophaga catalasegens]GJM50481.1 hypothetical protein RCZ15_14540 [Capnocytophaga catalasegens]GJM52085.1 hypothetical protein RCZ16_04030 [Capnocytophaga catalasegens]
MGGLGNAITFVGSLWGGWRGATTLINDLLKISDAVTDVQKTSGLAQKEVEGLWKEFGKFNTRTSRLELMNIAQIGGRLGITDKEQLQEFTREIDKIYVALGDSFQSGLEEVTTKVGKLKNLFDETKNSDYGTALNEIGSALNELGANGTASESNITDFATRIGQLPNALKPAIDRTLGLGAAFEESGIDAQVASSGYSKFVMVAGKNLEGFAKQMKITTEEATALFRTKPEEFFIKFGESMKGLSPDQSAKMLSGLKLNTQEVQKALGVAGDNANRFREMMELSSKSMLEATSIQNEFNQKNENAAAVWEKMGRVVKEFLTDGVVPEFFNWITNIVGYITGIVNEAGNRMERFRARLSFLVKTLLVVTTAAVSYRAAVWLVALATKEAWQQTILYNAATKVWHALTIAGRSLILTLRVAFSLLTLQIGAAKKAMDSFNTATKLSPWGAILAVISTAIVAYTAFKNKVDEAAESQKRANELQSAVNERMASEVQKVNDLVAVIESEITSRKDKERALKQLQEIAPEYFKTLDIDKIKTLEGKKAIDEYVKSLEKKYRTQVLQERMNANKSKLADMSKNKDVEVTFWQKMFNVGGSELDKDLEATYDQQMVKEKERAQEYLKQGYSLEKVEAFLQKRKKTLNILYAEKNAEMRKLKKSITEDEDEYKKLVEENPNLVLGDTPIDDSPKEGDTKTENGKTYVFKNGKWVLLSDGKKSSKYTDNVSKKAQDELLKAEREFTKKTTRITRRTYSFA